MLRFRHWSLGLFCLSVCLSGSPAILWAQDKDQHFLKKNAIAIKGGYHIYEKSDFTKFWEIDKDDYSSFAGELAYERKFTKHISLEIPLGLFTSTKTYQYRNIVSSGDTGRIDLTISNLYLSPTLKIDLPVSSLFQFYLGFGPDFYYTSGKVKGKYNSASDSGSYDQSDHFFSFGLHGLAGVELFIVRTPSRDLYDAAVSILFEYKYSYVPVKDFDKKVIDDINSIAGSRLGYNDFDAGGHLIFLGLRWYF